MTESQRWIDESGITRSAAAAQSDAAQSAKDSSPGGTPNGATGAVNPTWIAYNPLAHRRKDVRVHAAKASAAARKATIASKEARRRQQVRSKAARLATELWAAANANANATADANAARIAPNAVAIVSKAVEQQEPYEKLLALVAELHNDAPWYLRKRGETSLACTSLRTMMWNAMTSSTTLFQVAIFVAGTHANTCGIPRTALKHMGPGLVALRGASLEAIQAAVTAVDAEGVTPIAIALLAGWERRFGDAESYDVHMSAWKGLSLPAQALEENNVSTLTDLTLEMYRVSLDERSVINPNDSIVRTGPDPYRRLAALPIGYQVIDMKRPEARSLLALVAQFATHDPTSKGALPRIRELGLENMAWGPTHSHGVEPLPLHEAEMDQLELSALYHIRAATISLGGLLVQATMDANNVTWVFNLQAALYVHTISCPHLRTDLLLGTKFQRIGLWARFSICAIARDPLQDEFLRYLLRVFDITTFEQLRSILTTFLYPEAFCDTYFRSLFQHLMRPPEPDGHDMLPTPESLVSNQTT